MADETTQDVRIANIEATLGRIETKVEDGFEKMDGRVRRNSEEIAEIKGRASTAGIISGAVTGAVAGALAWLNLR